MGTTYRYNTGLKGQDLVRRVNEPTVAAYYRDMMCARVLF